MQFNHPEVLYALFLLIIPVIVHLFQLRRFRKQEFTNVKILKKLSRQTRKSSRLKKWLVLLTRLLLMTAIIFAFAQPFFPDKNEIKGPVETVIYLDNSYSMQAYGQRGRLLERSIQELLEKLPEEESFSLITNSAEYPDLANNDLQEVDYAAGQPDLEAILLKAENIFSENKEAAKKLLLISDFQLPVDFPEEMNDYNIEIFALQVKPERKANVKIDSAFISTEANKNILLQVQISATGITDENIGVSLYNGKELLGKSGVDVSENETRIVSFALGNEDVEEGIIRIEDDGFDFDNELYFTITKPQPIKIAVIGDSDNSFLNRIFSTPDFEISSMSPAEIDYNSITAASVIILNEVDELPNSLLQTLRQKLQEKTVFIVIPSAVPGNNFKTFLQELEVRGFDKIEEEEKLITGISFQHPLYKGVFEENVRNFDYPKTQLSFDLNTSGSSILTYQNNEPFLTGTNGNFIFSAPINADNSNFLRSPLVVPTFYNMGTSAIEIPQIYYVLGKTNRITVPVELPKDEVLQLSSEGMNFIPQQQTSSDKVDIITEEFPQKPGTFRIIKNEQPFMHLSYNVDRKESNMNYLDPEEQEDFKVIESVAEFISEAGYEHEENSLWKWFVIFAVLFMILETFLLKFLK